MPDTMLSIPPSADNGEPPEEILMQALENVGLLPTTGNPYDLLGRRCLISVGAGTGGEITTGFITAIRTNHILRRAIIWVDSWWVVTCTAIEDSIWIVCTVYTRDGNSPEQNGHFKLIDAAN